jgi:hypothetical protein
MEIPEILTKIYMDELGRVYSGVMMFRFVLQPTMASIAAVKDGLKDAREGKPMFFWALLSEPEHRKDLLRNGWKSVGRTFILGLVMDTIYQVWQLKAFYPIEAILTAGILGLIPYLLVRGPVNLWTRKLFPGYLAKQ